MEITNLENSIVATRCARRGKPSLCFSLLTRFWYPLDRAPHTDFLLFLLIFAAAGALSVHPQSTQPPAGAVTGQAATPSPAQAPMQSPPQPGQAPIAPPVPQAVTPHLGVVVLDPAHGGADQGARGSSGIAESDVVLSFARLVRISLEAQGLRVILTRQANEDPSFDDRSKLANAQHGVIFITLHVSSTGQPGTVRVYSLPQTGTPLRAFLARRACHAGTTRNPVTWI